MPDTKDFIYGSLIRYHFFRPFGLIRPSEDYWAVGYIVHRAGDHIRVSTLDPKKVKSGVIFDFPKKVRLDNIVEFAELQELPSKKP